MSQNDIDLAHAVMGVAPIGNAARAFSRTKKGGVVDISAEIGNAGKTASTVDESTRRVFGGEKSCLVDLEDIFVDADDIGVTGAADIDSDIDADNIDFVYAHMFAHANGGAVVDDTDADTANDADYSHDNIIDDTDVADVDADVDNDNDADNDADNGADDDDDTDAGNDADNGADDDDDTDADNDADNIDILDDNVANGGDTVRVDTDEDNVDFTRMYGDTVRVDTDEDNVDFTRMYGADNADADDIDDADNIDVIVGAVDDTVDIDDDDSDTDIMRQYNDDFENARYISATSN